MKKATFTIKRNQVIDMINGLKKLLRVYDNPETPGRFVELPLIANKDLCVNIKLEKEMICRLTPKKSQK